MRVQRRITERDVEAVAELARTLARARAPEEIARALVEAVCEGRPADFALLLLVDAAHGEARGIAGVADGEAVEWAPDVRLDLIAGQSATAVVVGERRPLLFEDAEASSVLNRALVERSGVKSAAFVPAMTDERVIGVLVAATLHSRHVFESEEVAILVALAGQAGLALERTRSEAALAEALDRERLVARIARQVRSELDLNAVLSVSTRETASALDLTRCFIRMGEPGRPMPIAAEWDAPGVEPIGEGAARLPVSNLAARERRTVATADVATATDIDDPLLGGRETLLDLGARAVLATPIVVFDRMIGVFGLHRSETQPWSEGEVALAEAVAREIGLAIHTAEILAENRERLAQQEALLKAAQAVTGELQLETVLERLVAELARLLGADAADCYFLDAEQGMLRCAAVYGLDANVIGWEVPADKGLAGQALRRGVAVLSEEYEHLRFEVMHAAYEGFARAIVAPMRWAGETPGVVAVGTRDPQRAYRPRDVETVEIFAGLAALAVRNAESFQRSAQQARIQRGFYRIAAVLSEPLSRSETLDAIAQAAAEALGGDFAFVLAPGPGGLCMRGSHELPEAVSRTIADGLPESLEILAVAAEERRALAAPSVAVDDRFGQAWRTAAKGVFASLLALPLEHREAAGLVGVCFREERRFSDDDLEVARHLSQAARGALDRSELYEAERTAHALSRQLARTGSRLAVELDPEAVVGEVVRQAPSLIGADAACLWELSGDVFIAGPGVGEGAEEVTGSRIPASARPVGDVVQGGVSVALASTSVDPAAGRGDPLLGSRYGACVGVPLVAAEGLLRGVLAVYAEGPREWRREEVDALEALAANASAALANAELYQRVALEAERLDAILASVADAIVAVDQHGRVVLWNAAAEQITGVPASEALGRPPEDVLRRSLSRQEHGAGAERLVSIMRGGEAVWLSVSEAVMRDPLGGVVGRVYAFRDVSAERAVEQLKSDFVASVSHELRAPLTSIFGFAETLLARESLFGPEERQTFLRYIASEAERLTNIVEQLLNVARLDAGDLEVQGESVEIGPVVSDVVARAERLDTERDHRFVVDLPPESLHAEADREALRQVLTNLVDNSVKFSPAGGTITVAARPRSDAVEITVADEGAGIPLSDHELIFRKFYRGLDANSEPRGSPGAGLGLFIARGLVQAMKGRMSMSSVEGKGSSFVFELPSAAQSSGEQR